MGAGQVVRQHELLKYLLAFMSFQKFLSDRRRSFGKLEERLQLTMCTLWRASRVSKLATLKNCIHDHRTGHKSRNDNDRGWSV